MVVQESTGTGCPRLSRRTQSQGAPLVYGLATCTKYNTSPPRGIPERGEELCARPGSSPTSCWLDLRACRKADIPRRAFERSFLGQHDPLGEPEVVLAKTDAYGREFYCLQRNGTWVHEGEHEFPVGSPG